MARPRFGEGDLSFDPSKSVFINCPFDAEYAPLFDAIVFATVCCGFMPRCALESGTVSEPRLARILRALFSSKYSIHDLSRCTGEGSDNTARFNMPLELGMAMARRFMEPDNEHDWLVMVPNGHTYARFISDLAAFDPATHDGSVPGVVVAVMSWLATRKDAIPPVTPKEVLKLLPAFHESRQSLAGAWGGFPPWADVIMVAIDVARQLG
ncbi:MAG: hypothetical protein IT165_15400 [Bryobacterales bacterium]|nr:hypothetical protein [Bryobacterales bacterium]